MCIWWWLRNPNNRSVCGDWCRHYIVNKICIQNIYLRNICCQCLLKTLHDNIRWLYNVDLFEGYYDKWLKECIPHVRPVILRRNMVGHMMKYQAVARCIIDSIDVEELGLMIIEYIGPPYVVMFLNYF